MKIENIRIRNFGILADVEIALAGPSGRLAFINGSNGRGKTSFQSALRWCLYGLEPADDKKFLSKLALKKDASSSIEVSLLFTEEDGSQSRVRRELHFKSSATGTAQRVGIAELTVWKQNASTGDLTNVVPNPEAWLREKFPSRLENFFLFDGEQMEKFFSSDVQNVIEDAVREIAGVDYFEALKQRLLEIERVKSTRAAKLGGSKAEGVRQKLEEETNSGKKLAEDFETNRARLAEIKQGLSQIDDILGGSAVTEKDAQRSRELDAEVDSARQELVHRENEFQQLLLQTGPGFLLTSAHKALAKHVATAKEKDELPPPFDPERLQNLLASEECICGCSLKPNTDAREKILSMVEKFSTAGEVGQRLRRAYATVHGFRQTSQQVIINIRDKNSMIIDGRNRLRSAETELSLLNEKLANSDVDAVKTLGHNKQLLDRERSKIIADQALIEKNIAEIGPRIERLRDELKKATSGSREAEKLTKEARLAARLSEAASQIHAAGIEKVRRDLETAVSARFSTVKRGKFKTQITETFRVETLDEDGDLASLSAGEQMMKAYIFAIALREVIKLSFPLIVDTPLGRLDEENSQALAKYLLEMTTTELSGAGRQIIFLMHSGEYTPYVKKQFAAAKPVESYFEFEEKFEGQRSFVGSGINPQWTNFTAWKDWSEGKLK
jgi:DNA sulfur modification protein DndD